MKTNTTYKSISMKLKLSKGELQIVRFISRKAKTMYNKAIANIKKHYQETGQYITKYDNYTELQNNEIKIFLNTEIMQKMIYKANEAYESYFELLKLKQKKKCDSYVKEPGYKNTKYAEFSFSYIGNRYEEGKRYFKIPLAVPYKRFLREIAPQPMEFSHLGVNPNTLGIPKDYFFKITLPKKN